MLHLPFGKFYAFRAMVGDEYDITAGGAVILGIDIPPFACYTYTWIRFSRKGRSITVENKVTLTAHRGWRAKYPENVNTR